MKKAIALIATLVVFTSSAFAQLAPSISGSAETQFGVNLDDERNGFEVETDVTVTVPLFAGEKATEGEGAYGSAAITGTTLTLDFNLMNDNDFDEDDGGYLMGTGAEGDVSAKLDLANGAYVTIGSSATVETSKVLGTRDYDINPIYSDAAGVSFGYDKGGITVEFTAVNESANGGFNQVEEFEEIYPSGDFEATDVLKEGSLVDGVDAGTKVADNDAYVLAGKVGYSAGDIFGISIDFATDMATETGKRLSVAAEITSTPIEGLTVALPFDLLNDDGNQAMELLPAVTYKSDAITAGASFHYLSVAKELNSAEGTITADQVDNNTATAEVIPTGYEKAFTTDDGTVYLSKTLDGTIVTATSVTGYIAPVSNAVTGAKSIYGSNDAVALTLLKVDFAYALDAGKVSLGLNSKLGEMEGDMDLGITLGFKADAFSVALNLGDVLHQASEAVVDTDATDGVDYTAAATVAGLDDIGLDGTFTGVDGIKVSLETTISLDEGRDNSAVFTVDKINLDFTDAITGLENTTLTVNYSGFNFEDTKGTFYVGAKITL